MPALGIILRQIVMALASAVPLTVIQNIVDGTLKQLVQDIKDENGLTFEEARDIVQNFLVDLATNAAVVGAVIKTKMAVRTAEFFGLSGRGFVKKTLTKNAEAVAAKLKGSASSAAVKSLGSKTLKFLAGIGGSIWLVNAIANVIEPGIYKPEQTNAVYRKLGIPFQYPTAAAQLAPGPFDKDQFNDYAKALESTNIRGFNDPYALQSRPYSRQALADIINAEYGKQVVQGNTPSAKQMIPLIAPYIIGGTPSAPQPSSAPAKTQPSGSLVPEVRVFTGVVSQGTLGNGISFTPRPDDLIENMAELQQAVSNNVAPFLAALAGRVQYEIKIVPSIVSGGIRKTGQAQTIVTGTTKDGRQRTKTIVNKFAVANLFIITERNTRTKLATLTLGPVDALRFQPGTAELQGLENALPRSVVTQNTDDIATIVTGTPTLVVPPASANEKISAPRAGYTFVYDGYLGAVSFNTATVDRLRGEVARGDKTLDNAVQELVERHSFSFPENSGPVPGPDAWANGNPNILRTAFSMAPEKFRALLSTGGTFTGTPQPSAETSPPRGNTAQIAASEPAKDVPANPLPPAALSAQTLSEFYAAQGTQLPPISERGNTYQTLGLGQAAFYTGTAEQNTRLLRALQGKPL